ncbi:MAG: DUF4890 domain-containing protein [Candidatus Azobacteroides sp.]|nr:DUF4890 domain-containing protein [Candidatus Azobacteroides sp.]
MRKSAMVMVSVLMISASVFGQQRQRFSPEDMAKKQTEQMTESLSLTDEQKAKVEAINLKYAQKQQQAFQSDKVERQARMEEMKKNHDDKDLELKSVLTSDQYTAYQQKQQERMKQAGDQKGGKGDWKGGKCDRKGGKEKPADASQSE